MKIIKIKLNLFKIVTDFKQNLTEFLSNKNYTFDFQGK